MSIFVSVPYCFDYYSFVVYFAIWEHIFQQTYNCKLFLCPFETYIFYQEGMFSSGTWQLFLLNVIIQKDRAPLCQSLCEDRSLTLVRDSCHQPPNVLYFSTSSPQCLKTFPPSVSVELSLISPIARVLTPIHRPEWTGHS